MKKNNLLKKRFFSIILTIAVVLSMMPTMAWAVNDDTVAVIGTKEYATLQAAIDAATSTSSIQLVKDVNENIQITDWKTCTINLGGHTWSGDGDVLTIKNGTVNLSNGKIKSNTGRGIYMGYSKVTLGEKMIVQGADGFSAIEIQYGSQTTLNLSDNIVWIRGLKVPTSKTLADYLPSGRTFVTCTYDESTGEAKVNSTDFVTTAYTSNEYTGNLALVSHEHQFTDGKCDCGAAYIAEITSGEQTTFVKALNSNVLWKSGELKLLDDAVITYDNNKTNYTLNTSGQNLTIDLNGHALTGNLVVGSGASLTMKDGSTSADGKMSGYLQVNGGALNIQSGTYQYAITSDAQGTINYYSGNLNISDGTFKRDSNNSGSSALRLDATFDEGEVSVTGGTFEGIYVLMPNLGAWYALTRSEYCFKKDGNPLTLPNGKSYFDDTVTVEECTSHSWETEENKSQYRCSYCGAINPNGLPEGTIAKIGTGKFYDSLGAAVTAVIAGEATGEITLVNDTSGENITLSSGNVTIDLNGKIWRNKYTSGNVNLPALTVGEGTMTVKNGNISAAKDNTVAPAVTVNGGTLIVQENVTLSGTKSHKATSGNEPALVVNGGNVNLAVGTILNNGIKVTADGKAAADYLPANAAFQRTIDGKTELIDGFTTKSTFDNLTVVEHTNHKFDLTTGKCPCGQICTHSYVDGVCSVCQYACPHESIDSTFKCTVCNTQMTVKITKDSTDTYAASLAAAISTAESGSTLTLLADISLTDDVTLTGKELTLALGNYSIGGSSKISLGGTDETAAGTLTITGSGGITPTIGVGTSGALNLNGWTGSGQAKTLNAVNITGMGGLEASEQTGRINTLKVTGVAKNNNIMLAGGTYGTIDIGSSSNLEMGTLLASGYALRAISKENDFVKYSSNSNSTNRIVVKCPHKSFNSNGYCEYCNDSYAAEVNGKYYKTLDAAIAEAEAGDIVKLLANVSGSGCTIDGDFTLNLNGKQVMGQLIVNSGSPKLIDTTAAGGTIYNLTIKNDATLADLLPEEWTFKIDGNWATEEELATAKTAAKAKVVQAPITSVGIISETNEVEYGSSDIKLTGDYRLPTGVTTYGKLYKVEEGKIEEVEATSRLCYTLPADLPVGTHIYRFTLTTSDGYSKSCDFTLTVKAADLSDADITIIKEPTYNGTAQLPEIEVKMGETKLVEGKDYTVFEGSKATLASTADTPYTLRINGIGNYTGATTATWQLKPATLTYTVTASPKKYDGTDKADVQVTFNYEENWIHLNDGDYIITANYDSDAPGENKKITGTVELKYPQIAIETTRNYILENERFSTTGSINKNTVTSPQAVSLTITNGVAKTYEVKLPALPELGEGCEYGDTKYNAVVDFGNNTGYYESEAAVTNGILTLPIKANQTNFTGTVGTVIVTVETANYEDITLTVNVSATNKLTPQLDGELTLSSSEITYGDKLSTIEISGKMKVGDTPVDGTFAWKTPDTAPDANNAYAADWIFTPKDSEKYEEVTGKATIVVKQAKPTGEPKYEKISASGKNLADAKLTAEGANFSVAGTLKWSLDDTTEVKRGVAYEWIYTPDNVNYETLTGTIVLWANASGGGGGSVVTPTEPVNPTEPTDPTNPSEPTNPDGTLTPAQSKLVKGVQNTTIVLKSKLTKKGKIRLTWTKSKGYKLDRFEIYRSVKKNSGYGKKAFFTTKDGSWSKYLNTKSLKKGKTYYYKLRGVHIIGGKKYYTQWSNKTWRTVK